MSAPFRDPCSRHLVRLPGSRGHACAPLGVCTCVSTPGLRLANCLCHCTSVHRLCTSVRHCLANCLCHCTSVHRSHTSFSAALSGKLPLSLYICTQISHIFSVQHCLVNCLSHGTSVRRPCTSPQSGSCVLVCGLIQI